MSGTLAAVMALALAGEPRFGVLADQQHVITTQQRPEIFLPEPPKLPAVEIVPMVQLDTEPDPIPAVAEPPKAPAKKIKPRKPAKKRSSKPINNTCAKE